MTNQSSRKKIFRAAALVFTLIILLSISVVAVLAVAASDEPAKHESHTAGKTVAQSGTLTAALVDPAKNAPLKTATVKVEVAGVKLIDPAMTNGKPAKGEGHLHYRVDDGPVIATTAPKLSFHELTPGTHKIVVVVANNDHSPTGLEQTLVVTIP